MISRSDGRHEDATELLDGTNRKLLNEIQWEFPLDEKPFAAIGRKIGTDESDAISRVSKLKASGIIRQINAIYDTRRLGYSSTLVSFAVGDEDVDAVAERINMHPGVSHNYRRDSEFNLWFTLATPPGTDVTAEAARLAEENGIRRWHLLPALKLYKIGVRLNMTGEEMKQQKDRRQWETPFSAGEDDKRFIRATQKDIRIIERPFNPVADELGMSVKELFGKFDHYQRLGVMRRFAAILRHQKAGFVANGMVCWKADEQDSARIADVTSKINEVSHCYMRPTYEDWPYSTFTMIHGRERKECEKIAEEISKQTGIADYVILYSTKEYKKQRVEYFV